MRKLRMAALAALMLAVLYAPTPAAPRTEAAGAWVSVYCFRPAGTNWLRWGGSADVAGVHDAWLEVTLWQNGNQRGVQTVDPLLGHPIHPWKTYRWNHGISGDGSWKVRSTFRIPGQPTITKECVVR